MICKDYIFSSLIGTECSAELVEVNDHTEDYNAQPYMSAGVDCIHELVYSIIRKQT